MDLDRIYATGNLFGIGLTDVTSGRAVYNTVALIRKSPQKVSVVEICPPGEFRPNRLSRDAGVFMEGYRQGFRLADESIHQWFPNK